MKRFLFVLLAAIGSLSLSEGQVVPGRYIVVLKGEPAVTRAALRTGAANRFEVLAAHRPAIQAEQGRIAAALESRHVRVVGAVQNAVNALIVEAPGLTRQELEQVPGVARVRPVRRYHLATDHAIGLHKVVDAWTMIGGYPMAGKGIRVGIIDTGIDIAHPGFTTSDLKMPDGFPQVNNEANRALTNAKVILAKNYDPLTQDAHDAVGHGTAVAMIAAGWPNAGPYGTLFGVAPEAYLGNYKVFPDDGSGALDDSIIRALDDALTDRMDVVNLSLGSIVAERPELDPLVQAVENVSKFGVIVVTAAGNDGPEMNTMSTPGLSPSAITVGNSWNDRVFAGSAAVDGLGTLPAMPGSGQPYKPVAGPMVDVGALDNTGLACSALPGGSLAGKVALILRGTCPFEDKLNNAQAAGATAALVYTYADSPDAFTMNVGAATLPAAMLSNADGLRVKGAIAQTPDLNVAVNFDVAPIWVYSTKLSTSSSKGPSVDYVKPNLVAVGENVSTAWNSSQGQPGYIVGGGTSFAAPMVTGAVALLKAARPGLRPDEYRSLIINSSAPFAPDGLNPMPVQQAGAGRLDVLAALNSTLATDIVNSSITYGIATGSSINQVPIFTVENLDRKPDHITLEVRPLAAGPAPVVIYTTSFDLDAGATRWLGAQFTANDLAPGAYQGFIVARSANTGLEMRIPYWYGVPSNVPQVINWMNPDDGTSSAGSTQYVLFRTTDAEGIPVAIEPVVTPGEGGARVVSLDNLDDDIPGGWLATVRLSGTPGSNRFTIQVGSLTKEVDITGN